ncbi:MAG: hypothetical protein HPY66_2587 [Firmicutes bacterium]|nr:hypothetical protein [Bacillota bacterium]MDI6705025.1 two-component system regulatory protein YycI [Bacillota bacterium]
MDWSRAKTILIIAFIITNLFLGYNVWQKSSYGYVDERAKEERITEVVALLESKGVEVEVVIPRDTQMQGILTVEYMEIFPQELASLLFRDRSVYPVTQGNSVKYVDGSEILEIKNNREVFYTNLDRRNGQGGNLLERDAIRIGETFLKEIKLYKPGMVIDKIASTETGYYINYIQQYQGRQVEVSLVQMEVTSKGVYSMHMLWLNPVRIDNNTKKIIPAIEALIKVVSKKEIAGKPPVIIEGINLIYYFDWEDAKEGEAFPVWKIRVNGKNYYINALTGQFN